MDGSLLVSQSRSLSCSYILTVSIQQAETARFVVTRLFCSCTLGSKHIEVSICAVSDAESDDAASDDGEMSFSMQGKDGAATHAACMLATEKQR